MIRLAMVLAAASALPTSGAAQTSISCGSERTQLDMNFCARAGWEIADGELNALWRIVKPAADRRGQGDALLTQQRAWLKYRDTTCEAERDQYRGGSIAPLVYWQCMDRMTIQRNADLRALR